MFCVYFRFYTLLFIIIFLRKPTFSNSPALLIYTSSYILAEDKLGTKKNTNKNKACKKQSFSVRRFGRHKPAGSADCPPEGKRQMPKEGEDTYKK